MKEAQLHRMINSSAKRDPVKFARVFAKRNPEDDGFTDGLVRSLARLFPRAELTRAEEVLVSRKKQSKASRRQLEFVRRARRITYLPLNKRWSRSNA